MAMATTVPQRRAPAVPAWLGPLMAVTLGLVGAATVLLQSTDSSVPPSRVSPPAPPAAPLPVHQVAGRIVGVESHSMDAPPPAEAATEPSLPPPPVSPFAEGPAVAAPPAPVAALRGPAASGTRTAASATPARQKRPVKPMAPAKPPLRPPPPAPGNKSQGPGVAPPAAAAPWPRLIAVSGNTVWVSASDKRTLVAQVGEDLPMGMGKVVSVTPSSARFERDGRIFELHVE